MKCALTDENLIFIREAKNRKLSNASLDRIDSSIGYVKGNVQWVTKNVNVAKQSMSQEKFISVCQQVASKFKSLV
jgi:hypothetical protein